MTRVLIVADDLTGAMDAAAPFADADAGVAARVLLRPSAEPGWPAGMDVLSIDTDSRERRPDQAAASVREAFSSIDAAGALLFKKIDSTLRGHLAPELRAALGATGRHLAIVAPAAPAQGRTLCDGHLFVDGRPSGERSLASRLRDELAGFDVRPLADAGQLELPDRPTVYVVDAQTDAQLDEVARFGVAHQEHVLLAGSSGLSGALARCVAPPIAARVEELPRYARVWFLVGSYHARSARQVRALLESTCTPRTIVISPAQPPTRDDDLAAPIGLVHVEGLGEPPRLDAAWITDRLGKLAADLAARGSDTVLLLTGGATARAVLERLGACAIDILGSQRAGVVHGRVAIGARTLGMVTKSGGFGAPGLLAELARELAA